MKWLSLMAFAYLLGSVPTGVLVARLFGGDDPRKMGSGNIGATNVARTAGKLPGILTLAGDALKGLIPAAWAAASFDSALAAALVGLAAYLGHLFSVFLRFKGGKGVATASGVFLALATGPLILAAIVFGAVVWKWRMVSLGSLSAAAALPLLCGFLGEPAEVTLLALVVAGLTVWRHWANVERIVAGTERKIDAVM
jgi:glycerol-3-phosphate acyltransferase PlsY